ncbi:hypothetical protein AAJCM20276_28350 [Acetobacter aceti]|uniref:Uncharacterized protein n=1 Tax=Acetobacter aceti TaxID=435 RepID=A0A6S6PNF2_ACEAC|nr:hypothetical protein AAJCM20276_28350 [Acetobacter aceti]
MLVGALSGWPAGLGEKMAPCPVASAFADLLSEEPEAGDRETPALLPVADVVDPADWVLEASGLCLLNSKKKPRHSFMGRWATR